MKKFSTARFALVAFCALATAGVAAPASAIQCAPYARAISGIEIRGNADTWWGQAAGRYERGHAPRPGAVLAFAATHRMRVGHVAMVSRVVSDREVLLTHANWSRRGAVETDVRAIDVSAAGDWSQVKVWYGPQGGIGTTAYPTLGFIYAAHPRDEAVAGGATAIAAITGNTATGAAATGRAVAIAAVGDAGGADAIDPAAAVGTVATLR